jgi:hypothetical protein
MQPSGLHYFPLAWPFLLALLALFIVVVALIEFRVLKYAYDRTSTPCRPRQPGPGSKLGKRALTAPRPPGSGRHGQSPGRPERPWPGRFLASRASRPPPHHTGNG